MSLSLDFSYSKAGYTPKTRCNFITTDFGSYLAAFCLLMNIQFLLFNKSGEWSLQF